jgi:GH24 family phage-related lysozyme (muramidase)
MPNWNDYFHALSRGLALPEPRAIARTRPLLASFHGEADFGAASADDVKAAQHWLNVNGYGPLAEDGDPGPQTQAATKRFQASKGLSQDGLIGPQTLGAMGIKKTVTPLQTVKGPSIPGLRQAVVNAFPDFSGKFEGKALPFPYTDSKGLVTTGTGTLMEPLSTFQAQPWRHGVGGPLATADEKESGYNAVKAGYPGVQSVASQSLTDLRLNPEDLNALLFKTLTNNHNYLKSHIPNYTAQPADAQMAHHSMAWAWGPGFTGVWGGNGQQYLAQLAAGDYAGAADTMEAANAHEMTINPGIVPRVAATKQLLLNADAVVKGKKNLDTLFWPGDVVTAIATGIMGVTMAWGGVGLGILAGMAAWNRYKTGKWSL